MTRPPQIEDALWRALAARGEVQGEPAFAVRTPWAVRALMGAAGWLGALFFQLFIVGGVFAAVRGNGFGIAVTGIAMVALAAVLYRRDHGIALGQFALAVSLGGQGLAIFGVAEGLGLGNLAETTGFWAGVAAFEAVLYVAIPNRLHRLLAALGIWACVAAILDIALVPAGSHVWLHLSPGLGWIVPLACALATWFTLAEARLCADARHALLEPAADATLLAALGAALLVTGTSHPLAFLDAGQPAPLPSATGILTGVVLAGFALAECRRLAYRAGTTVAVVLAALAFSLPMFAAPAVSAGGLAMGLALRRASLAWLGLGIAAILAGFVWYYSALQWTLLAKSATLVAAGVVLLGARQWLLRAAPVKEAA